MTTRFGRSISPTTLPDFRWAETTFRGANHGFPVRRQAAVVGNGFAMQRVALGASRLGAPSHRRPQAAAPDNRSEAALPSLKDAAAWWRHQIAATSGRAR